MKRLSTVANQISQEALDALLSERLDWAARFASAAAHDMGNLALIASIMQSDPGAQPSDPKARELQQSLLEQIRATIDAVDLWRTAPRLDVQPRLLKNWWTVHGRFVRQFLPATVRVTVQSAGDDTAINAVALCKAMAAVFVAVSAQIHPLEKIAINISCTADGDLVEVCIETSPGSATGSMLLPTLLRSHIATGQGRLAKPAKIDSSLMRLLLAAPIRARMDERLGIAASEAQNRASVAE